MNNGPHKIPDWAREVMCYFEGEDGDEIAAWFAGKIFDFANLRVRDGGASGFGSVTFRKPEGATMLTLDQFGKQALFT